MKPIKDFKLQLFIDVMQELARCDEIENALKIPGMLPGYYRDNPPEAITYLKNEIMANIATVDFYKNTDFFPGPVDYEDIKGTLRYELLVKEVKHLNNIGYVPHIVDYGPGEFWVPVCLNKLCLSFTYQPISLNDVSFNKAKHLFEHNLRAMPPQGQPTIYLALEIIEHLWNENEVLINMLSAAGSCDIIHVSTPKYTHNYENESWLDTGTLGHLRTYTPMEFFTKVQDMFGSYSDFMFYDGGILHARGMNKGSSLEKYQLELDEKHSVV